MKIFKQVTGSVALTACLLGASAAWSCESDAMLEDENGFLLKIIAGSDKVVAYTDSSKSEEAFPMELLQPYFVICEEGDFYKITDLQTDSVEEAESGQVGYADAAQVFIWNTREALSFSKVAFLADRPEIVAWDNEGVLKSALETGDVSTYPPAFRENLEATRSRERATRPYPVLGSDLYNYLGAGEKRAYNVLLPAALTPAAHIEVDAADVEQVEEALTAATFVVVFDATGSMTDFALATVNAINGAIESLGPEVAANSQMGFVFYRDIDDPEKLVAVPPIPMGDAARALKRASELMEGGGDIPEPVLDAVYYGANNYNVEQGGKIIMIAVLNGDAKPQTISLDERVPSGLDVLDVSQQLAERSIPVITVQASADAGPNLVRVLSTLAENSGGSFIPFGAGLDARKIAAELERVMVTRRVDEFAAGEAALGAMTFDLKGHASIPLEVLDGEMLERLREAGVDFNIDPGVGGLLIRKGYIWENDEMLEPQIAIEGETLRGLVNLFSVLAITGSGEEEMRRAISTAVAAIAGEDFDPEETISEIVSKKLGIQFRTPLLKFDINFLAAMLPEERLAYAKRFEEASTKLDQYYQAHLEEFDTQVAVWMPIAALP